MIGSRIIPACPYNLTLRTLYVPFSAPAGPRGGTYPASTVIHHCPTIEWDRGCSGSRLDKIAPRRIPGLTADLSWPLTQNRTHKVETAYGHIPDQPLPH